MEIFIAGAIMFAAGTAAFLWLNHRSETEGFKFMFLSLGLLSLMGGFGLLMTAPNIMLLDNVEQFTDPTTNVTVTNHTSSYNFVLGGTPDSLFSGYFIGFLYAVMLTLILALFLLIVRAIASWGGLGRKHESKRELYERD